MDAKRMEAEELQGIIARFKGGETMTPREQLGVLQHLAAQEAPKAGPQDAERLRALLFESDSVAWQDAEGLREAQDLFARLTSGRAAESWQAEVRARYPEWAKTELGREVLALDPAPTALLLEKLAPLMRWARALAKSKLEDSALVSSVYPFVVMTYGQLRAIISAFDAAKGGAPAQAGLPEDEDLSAAEVRARLEACACDASAPCEACCALLDILDKMTASDATSTGGMAPAPEPLDKAARAIREDFETARDALRQHPARVCRAGSLALRRLHDRALAGARLAEAERNVTILEEVNASVRRARDTAQNQREALKREMKQSTQKEPHSPECGNDGQDPADCSVACDAATPQVLEVPEVVRVFVESISRRAGLAALRQQDGDLINAAFTKAEVETLRGFAKELGVELPAEVAPAKRSENVVLEGPLTVVFEDGRVHARPGIAHQLILHEMGGAIIRLTRKLTEAVRLETAIRERLHAMGVLPTGRGIIGMLDDALAVNEADAFEVAAEELDVAAREADERGRDTQPGNVLRAGATRVRSLKDTLHPRFSGLRELVLEQVITQALAPRIRGLAQRAGEHQAAGRAAEALEAKGRMELLEAVVITVQTMKKDDRGPALPFSTQCVRAQGAALDALGALTGTERHVVASPGTMSVADAEALLCPRGKPPCPCYMNMQTTASCSASGHDAARAVLRRAEAIRAAAESDPAETPVGEFAELRHAISHVFTRAERFVQQGKSPESRELRDWARRLRSALQAVNRLEDPAYLARLQEKPLGPVTPAAEQMELLRSSVPPVHEGRFRFSDGVELEVRADGSIVLPPESEWSTFFEHLKMRDEGLMGVKCGVELLLKPRESTDCNCGTPGCPGCHPS